MEPVRVIMVGGFLGAGKTTLLWEAAQRLMEKGRRVGLITNDQAPDLVDTAFLSRTGLAVREVAGSCFCCNFQGLIDAADTLRRQGQPDVLIAEPVGSCTDLSSTLLQPLKDKFRRQFKLAPLSVLADPDRLREVLSGRGGKLHRSAGYIFRKQLEEADLIVLNKMDLLAPEARQEIARRVENRFPGVEVREISALTGAGVEEWLEDVLSGGTAGRRIIEVDYDVYAEGEAVLGWLNASILLTRRDDSFDWMNYCLRLLETLQQSFRRQGAEVGHVKLFLSSEAGGYVGNLTRTESRVVMRGELRGSPRDMDLVLNARVELPPAELEQIVRRTLGVAGNGQVQTRIRQLRSLSPGRPQPTFRYDKVV